MWALLSSRLRTWVLLSVIVPLIAAAARFAAKKLEQRGGPTRLSGILRSVGNFGRKGDRTQ